MADGPVHGGSLFLLEADLKLKDQPVCAMHEAPVTGPLSALGVPSYWIKASCVAQMFRNGGTH